MASITERVESGDLILLDGGVSTEIQRRGVPLDPNVWSGLTTKTNPDEVRAVHEDYIRAGSDVITANTYATARHVLEAINLGHESKILNLKSVQLAQQARDAAADHEVWIAGSMSSMPPLTANHEAVINRHAVDSYRELAEVLVMAGVDLIICEMMRDVENAEIVIETAVATGLPVWVGYSAMVGASDDDVKGLRWLHDDSLDSTHDFGAMLDRLAPLGGQAAGIMHTDVDDISPALDVLKSRWDGPLMAYAETGHFSPPNWEFDHAVSPEDYLQSIRGWIDRFGIQVVGGCCGTGPEHISLMHRSLRGRND